MREYVDMARILTNRVIPAVAKTAVELGIRKEWRGRLQTEKFNIFTVSDRLWRFKIRFVPEWDIYEKWNFRGVLPFGAVGTFEENLKALNESLYHDLNLNNVMVLGGLLYGCRVSEGWFVEKPAWSKKNIQVVK